MVTTHDRLRKSSSRLLGGALLALAGTLLAGPTPATAQPVENAKPKLLISNDLKTFKDLEKLQTIVLRPNIEQPVYLYVTNPGQDVMKNVAVKLVKVLVDNTVQTLADATVPVVRPGQRERLIFGKPAPALEKGKPIPWPELDGPPFRFEIWAGEAGAKEGPAKTPVVIKIMEPREYMTFSDANYEVAKQRFSVSITAQNEFFGPKADVELVLSPEVIPGLVPKKVAGAYRQVITQAGDKVQLVADKLLFKGTPPKHGRVYVTVDGYERAFIFNNSFTEGAPVPLSRGTRARIVAPRFAVPGAKCPVNIEVDDAPTTGGIVDFGFDRAGDDRFAEQKLAGFREQHVFFVPEGPKGGMAFKTIVHDWKTELDTAEVYGPRQLRVRLFDLDKKTNDKGTPIDLVNEQARTDERLPLFERQVASPYAPLAFDTANKAMLAEINLDGTPPERIAFVGWPKQLARGKALLLKATGRDDESGISKVTFFLGEPVDGKMPPKAIESPGKQIDAQTNVWVGELPIATAKPGKFEVSVQFTNGAGLSAAETVVIELVDAPKGGAKAGTTIKGKVFQGELAPPDVAVTLVDDKNNIKAATKTNKTGQYVIEGVAPGTYRVVAVRSADSTEGQTAITVPEGKELIEGVDVQISR